MQHHSFTYLLRENIQILNFTFKYLKTKFLGLVYSAPRPLNYTTQKQVLFTY